MRLFKISQAIVKQGKLTLLANFFLTLFGFGIIYVSLVASPNIFILTLGLSVGFVCVSLAAYANKAESLDLPAPFTNDPLGWRKAKESYKAETQDKQEGADKQ